MMHHICYSFYRNIKKWSKLGQKKCFFVMFYCTLWVMPQNFSKWKTLLRYIYVLSVINIAFVEIKNFQSLLYCFKIHEMFPFWRFLGPYFPKYCSILLKFSPELVSNKINTVWKILQNFAFWLKWDAPKVYSFGPFWSPIYCRKTKNIAKNQNFSKSYILRNIK